MGYTIEVRFKDIVPCEGMELRKESLAMVVNQHEARLPITPIPTRRYKNSYLQLDGRHRLIIAKLVGYDNISIYVASSSKDLMKRDDFPTIDPITIFWNNIQIGGRFSKALSRSRLVQSKDHVTNYDEYVKKLREVNPVFKSYDSLKEYLRRNGLFEIYK